MFNFVVKLFDLSILSNKMLLFLFFGVLNVNFCSKGNFTDFN